MLQKNLKYYLIAVLGILTLFAISSPTPVKAAKHTETIPKVLRGTWYQANSKYNSYPYKKSNRGFKVMKVSAHSVTKWKANKAGKRISPKYVLLASKYTKDYRHLLVTKETHKKNGQKLVGWNLPDMKLQSVQPKGTSKNTIGFTDGWACWTTRHKYRGKTYKTFEAYERMGWYEDWTRVKVHHDFSHQNNSALKIGMKP